MKKPVWEVQVGDTMVAEDGERVVIAIDRTKMLHVFWFATFDFNTHSPSFGIVQAHPENSLEVLPPDLTPAQQHAEELAKRLWGIVDDFDNGNFIDLNAARALLASIRPPEPPTLAEALAALDAVIDLPPGSQHGAMKESFRTALDILDRARRAGMLK